MFFLLSKLFWIAASPTNVLVACICLGAALLYGRAWLWGRRLVSFGAVLAVLIGAGPLGAVLMTPLENRFPRPKLTSAPTGIIVLGGGINETISKWRGSPTLVRGGSRMPEAVVLALRYPGAKLVFTGGSADLGRSTTTEAAAARIFFTRLGIAPDRLILESKSRNTYENAKFTRALVRPQAGQVWLLVTSAYHMPRAVGVFRKAGFPVRPWPAGYRTTGRWSDVWRLQTHLSQGVSLTDTAVHEWIGLFAYWATGKTDALFPAPSS